MKVLVIMSVILFIVGCDNAMAIKDYQDADKVTNDSWQDTNKAEAEVLPDTNDNTVQDTQADADIEINDNQPDNEQPDTAPGYEVQGNEVIDHVTGYIWQKSQSTEKLTYEQAVSYCDNLVINDITHWSIPTISQLRTIIRDCPTVMIDGKCRVTDLCNSYKQCWDNEDACSCILQQNKAPFIDKTIWDLPADKDAKFYSNTENPDTMPGYKSYWLFGIKAGAILSDASSTSAYVKCIKL